MHPTNIHRFLMDIQTLDIKIVKDESNGMEIMSLSHHTLQLSEHMNAFLMSEIVELTIIDLLLLPRDQLQNVINRLATLRTKCESLIISCENVFYDNTNEAVLVYLVKNLPICFLTGKSVNELDQYRDISRYSHVVKFFTDVIRIVQYKIKQINRVLGSIAVASSVEPIRYTKHTNERRASTRKPGSSFVSYQWTGKRDNSLKEFFNLLNSRYITDTTFDEFKSVFTEQPIDVIKPIRWTGSTTELIYLILSLMPVTIVGDPDLEKRRMDWKKFSTCFVKKDGSPFDDDLPSLKNKLDRIGSETRLALDNIIYEIS